jgi:hypothetical protein
MIRSAIIGCVAAGLLAGCGEGTNHPLRETIVIAAKDHLRHWMGGPEDWLPPEDRE